MKSWLEYKPTGPELDLRSLGPVRTCICGSDLFNVTCSFDERGELSFYLLDAVCFGCGSYVTVPVEGEL